MDDSNMRVKALELAVGKRHVSDDELVARADLFYKFLSGDWKKPEDAKSDGDQST